jgi:hypothetical protein
MSLEVLVSCDAEQCGAAPRNACIIRWKRKYLATLRRQT